MAPIGEKHIGAVTNERDRLVVIGWDGASWDLLTPWVRAGRLPHLSRLMAAGSYGVLESTPLPVSPAAWSTIVTGQNPAKHGVFDWFERKTGSYDVEYVHTGRIAALPLWQAFNEGGRRIGVFNLPMVYPAVPVDGFMVSGIAAPSPHAVEFAYPPELVSELEANVGPYLIAEPDVFKYGREDAYFRSLLEWLDYQTRVVQYLIENQPCDCYLFVFMQTDHAQHKFWRYMDSGYPGYLSDHDTQFQDLILHIYQAVDDVLGKLMACLDDDTTFVLLSDHGAGPAHGVMYVNRWLNELGLLQLSRRPTTLIKYWLAKSDIILQSYRLLASLGFGRIAHLVSKAKRDKILNSFLSLNDVDWSGTRAYSRGVLGQIFINLKGREPLGIVEPGDEYEELCREIISQLEHLCHPATGEPLISKVCRRGEIYNGPYANHAADIVFAIQDHLYEASAKLGLESDDILGPSEYEDSGSHRSEGILVMAGSGIRRGHKVQNATVADVMPTLLALADLPIPSDLDGQPIYDAFREEQKTRIRFEKESRSAESKTEAPVLRQDEKEILEKRLRNLGYL